MPEERTEKKKVERALIRSSEVESQKTTFGSRQVGFDTAIRSSKVEKSKKEVKSRE